MWLVLPIPFWSKSSELACVVLIQAGSDIIGIWGWPDHRVLTLDHLSIAYST
jgi:hypothetical protein